MNNSFIRTTKIIYLALRITLDFRKAARLSRKLEGAHKEEALEKLYVRSGTRVRKAAFNMQGLIIKVGQFLSTRTDVLPRSFTKELAQLQDAVPASPFISIKPLIESELGAEITTIFDSFEQVAIAAASLGQVHRAKLKGGEPVAVKVLRPDIEKLAAIDLSALEKVINLTYKYTKTARRLNLTSLFKEFRDMVRQELDYRLEAANLRKFRQNFAEEKYVVVPRLHDTYVARRVLVMEFIEGAKITDVDTFSEWGISSEAVVNMLIDAYLKQLLHDGSIHVDPHPGNLFVLPDGRISFVDFGMMSELPKEHRNIFRRLINAAIARNMDVVVEAIDDLGFLQPHANRQILKKALNFILDRLSGIELRRGTELNQFADDFQRFLYDEPIIIQAKYMFLGRAVGLVSGLASSLYPEIKWMTLLKDRALPMLNATLDFETSETSGFRRIIRDFANTLFGETGSAAADIIFDQAKETGLAFVRVPGLLERTLHKVEQGELYLRTDLNDLYYRMERQERVMNQLIWVLLFSISGAIGAYLHSKGDYISANVAWGLTALVGIGILRNIIANRIFRKRMVRPPHLRSHQ